MRIFSLGAVHFALLCLAVFATSLGCSSEVERDESQPPPEFGLGGAAVVRVEGELSLAALALVTRAIKEAKESNRSVLIIDLDTPGGSIDTMRTLANVINEAGEAGGGDLRTVTWVHNRAWSAGVFVSLATERTYMVSRGSIGAATPVTTGPAGMAPLPEEGGVRAKVMSAMRGQARSWAEERNRPPALAEAMIDSELEVVQIRVDGEVRYITRTEWSDLRQSGTEARKERTISAEGELLALTASEAVATGFADGIADTLEALLEKVGAGEREPLMVFPKKSEELLGWLDLATPILIAFGLMLAFTELKMPGFGLPGILSLVCFAVAFGGRYFVGLADMPQLVLVTIGFALVAIELFAMPGTVWFGLSGGLLIISGIFWSQLGTGFALSNPLDRRFIFDGAFKLLATAAGALVASMMLVRFLPGLPMAKRLIVSPREGNAFGDGLPELDEARSKARIGARGEVLTDLRPVGKVLLGGDRALEFEARSPGAVLVRGTKVVVVEVSGDRLVVEALTQEEA